MAKKSTKSKPKAAKPRKKSRPRMTGDALPAPRPGQNYTPEVRKKSLDEALQRWCDLQDEEDALIEKYINPVRDKKNEIKQECKREYDTPIQAFNARANLLRIERKDGNDEVVLALNELFEATPVGNNLDLVELAERVATKRAEKEAEAAARAAAKAEGKTTETDL